MNFLFNKNKGKSHQDLCRQTKDGLQKLQTIADPKLQPRVEEDLAKNMGQIKLVLQGTQETESSPDQQYSLINSLMSEDVLPLLSRSIHLLPFESRKDAQLVFSALLRFKAPHSTQPDIPHALNYIAEQRPDIIPNLCHGYDHRESAMHAGSILREALRLDAVAALILYDEPLPPGQKTNLREVDATAPSSGAGVFWKFFDWIDKSAFEVSADAFATFSEIFTKQKKLSSHYLSVNMQLFVQRYNDILIRSTSYVTKRQSLKLLSTLLLERANYTLMTRYIESADNLKLIMLQLKDDRRMVNYEAFHVFKIFIANPQKSVPVQRILINNREKLLRFLPGFLAEREEDMQFSDEKAYLVKMIEALPAQPVVPPAEASKSGAEAGVQQVNGQITA